VFHKGHPPLGVLPLPRSHETLPDDPGALDSAGHIRHDRLAHLPGTASQRVCPVSAGAAPVGGQSLLLQVVDLRLEPLDLRPGIRRGRLILVQALYLPLQDAHRLAERARRPPDSPAVRPVLRDRRHFPMHSHLLKWHRCGSFAFERFRAFARPYRKSLLPGWRRSYGARVSLGLRVATAGPGG